MRRSKFIGVTAAALLAVGMSFTGASGAQAISNQSCARSDFLNVSGHCYANAGTKYDHFYSNSISSGNNRGYIAGPSAYFVSFPKWASVGCWYPKNTTVETIS
jgi:hypothetical protein